MKTCRTCRCKEGPDCEFAAKRRDCRVCQREATRQLRDQMRDKLIARLGGECRGPALGMRGACHGWPLEIDHIAGDGDEERGTSPHRGGSDIGQLSRWLKEVRSGTVRVQLLCPRHHKAKTRREKAFLKGQQRRNQ